MWKNSIGTSGYSDSNLFIIYMTCTKILFQIFIRRTYNSFSSLRSYVKYNQTAAYARVSVRDMSKLMSTTRAHTKLPCIPFYGFSFVFFNVTHTHVKKTCNQAHIWKTVLKSFCLSSRAPQPSSTTTTHDDADTQTRAAAAAIQFQHIYSHHTASSHEK